MTNPRGTAYESKLVRYLAAWWPHVERRARNGSKDRGDIAGIVGVVVEAKNCRAMDLAGWVDEAEAERVNDGAAVAVTWHKRRGKGSPGEDYVTMTGHQFVALLIEAGYGPPCEEADS